MQNVVACESCVNHVHIISYVVVFVNTFVPKYTDIDTIVRKAAYFGSAVPAIHTGGGGSCVR